jgi:hypothetical protein
VVFFAFVFVFVTGLRSKAGITQKQLFLYLEIRGLFTRSCSAEMAVCSPDCCQQHPWPENRMMTIETQPVSRPGKLLLQVPKPVITCFLSFLC